MHGCIQTGPGIMKLTKIDEVIQRDNLVVIYPSQKLSSNPVKCWNFQDPKYLHRGTKLYNKFLSKIDEVKKEFKLHDVPVLVGGFSSGALFTSHMAICYPEVFSGALIHSGGPFNIVQKILGKKDFVGCEKTFIENSQEIKLKYVLIVHGKKDKITPYFFSKMVRKQFDELLELSETPFDIEQITIDSMGHKWSGGEEGNYLAYPQGPEITDYFFKKML